MEIFTYFWIMPDVCSRVQKKMIIQNGPPSLWLPVTTGGFLTKREEGVERQTRDTGEGALRKFFSKKRDESEKFSDSEVCDKIKRLAD